MAKIAKKLAEARKKVDSCKHYSLDDASALIKEVSYTKFDGTVELAMNLNVDPRHADQNVRGAIPLPHGLGKTARVIVFAKGEKIREAEEAGADVVGAEDMVQRIQEGWLDFDVVVATPDMMGLVGRLGRVLGSRGLMPNPKTGTVTMNVAQAVKEAKAGRVEFRVNKAGIIHAPVGKISFDAVKIKENLAALMDAIVRARPAAVKGAYVKSAYISATMSPGLRLDVSALK
jgi:large subunit ribosomal protein L1